MVENHESICGDWSPFYYCDFKEAKWIIVYIIFFFTLQQTKMLPHVYISVTVIINYLKKERILNHQNHHIFMINDVIG